MGLLTDLRKLILRAFPELGGRHLLRMGEVVAIADPPAEEQGTDRFRPRYAVDIQPLTPQGEPDPGAPVLKGLPLPALGPGQGRGVYAFPEPGARVVYAFAYGSPAHPVILAAYPQGGAIPALAPADILIQAGESAWQRLTDSGIALQTDGELREDSHTRAVTADEASETLGALTRDVDGDQVETIAGRLDQTVLGSLLRKVAGDARLVTLGGEDRTIGGDRGELVGGKAETSVNLDVILKSALGDVLVESVLSTATVKAAIHAALEGATVSAGNGAVELLAILDAVLTALLAETHGTGVGPSTAPLNAADYTAQQTQLGTIKS